MPTDGDTGRPVAAVATQPGNPERVTVIGSRISVCDIDGGLQRLQRRLGEGDGGYVCFTNAHTAVEGRRDATFRTVTNQSLLSMADGKPVYWVGRLRGARALGHAPGPDFMMAALRRYPDRRHYFYGSTPEVLARLQASLRERIPGLNICGAFSPPFGAQAESEQLRQLQAIRDARPDFIWVGLGAPKQERWMAAHWQALAPGVLLGVGAAFDFHAGTVRRAPGALRAAGLEWLYRLVREPRRMWRRYLTTNTLFLLYALGDTLRSSPESE